PGLANAVDSVRRPARAPRNAIDSVPDPGRWASNANDSVPDPNAGPRTRGGPWTRGIWYRRSEVRSGFGGLPSWCERMLASDHARGPDGLLHEPGGFPVVTLDSGERRVGSSFDLRPNSSRVRAVLQIGRRGGWDSKQPLITSGGLNGSLRSPSVLLRACLGAGLRPFRGG